MKNLLSRMGMAALVAANALTYSGCEVLSNDPQIAQAAERRVMGALAGGVIGGAVINRGVATDNAGAIALGQGIIDYSTQQPSVVVNNVPSQPVYVPAQQSYPKQVQNLTPVTMHEFNDFNGNGMLDSDQERGKEGYNFVDGKTAVVNLDNTTGNTIYIRFTLKEKDRIITTSPFAEAAPNRAMTFLVRPGYDIDYPGDYTVTVSDNEGRILGTKMFVVTPASSMIAQGHNNR